MLLADARQLQLLQEELFAGLVVLQVFSGPSLRNSEAVEGRQDSFPGAVRPRRRAQPDISHAAVAEGYCELLTAPFV